MITFGKASCFFRHIMFFLHSSLVPSRLLRSFLGRQAHIRTYSCGLLARAYGERGISPPGNRVILIDGREAVYGWFLPPTGGTKVNFALGASGRETGWLVRCEGVGAHRRSKTIHRSSTDPRGIKNSIELGMEDRN